MTNSSKTNMQENPNELAAPSAREVDTVFGPILAFENDLITDVIIKYGAQARNEVAMLRSFVSEGDLVYDIGAHIGTYTIPLAIAAGPKGLVVAIEANPDHFQLLWHNLQRRNLASERTAISAIIGDEVAPYSYHRVSGNTGASYFQKSESGAPTETRRFDDFHRQLTNRVRKVSIIKIDVEGMELSVLRSASQTISTDHPLLYIEIAPSLLERHGTTIQDVEAFLRLQGYSGLFRNVGERHSTNDTFQLAELPDIASGGEFFDLLAIHQDDPRLSQARSAESLERRVADTPVSEPSQRQTIATGSSKNLESDTSLRAFAYWDNPDQSILAPFTEHWRAHFPNFHIYGDDAVLPLLAQYHSNLPFLYRKLAFGAAKSDIARMALLLKYGGLYTDAHFGITDAARFNELGSLLKQFEVVFVWRTYGTQSDRPRGQITPINGLVLARPGSTLIRDIIVRAAHALENHWELSKKQTILFPYSVWHLIGSGNIEHVLLEPETGNTRVRSIYENRVTFVYEDGAPFQRNFFSAYRKPGAHWSQRQNVEPLFLPD